MNIVYVLGPFAAPLQTVLAENILEPCIEFVTIAVLIPGCRRASRTRGRRTETWPDGKSTLQRTATAVNIIDKTRSVAVGSRRDAGLGHGKYGATSEHGKVVKNSRGIAVGGNNVISLKVESAGNLCDKCRADCGVQAECVVVTTRLLSRQLRIGIRCKAGRVS